MKPSTKQRKLAEMFGLELPDPKKQKQRANVSREAEAALAYYEEPTAFTHRICKNCKREFAVNRAQVAYCSDYCRTEALAAIGIDYDVNAPIEQRWGIKEPLVVVPEALTVIRQVSESEPRGSENPQQLPEVEDPVAIDDYLASLGLP